ncbi:monovalent cation/H+ antiporter complex subunit F [Brachybacterium sp. YJGR34]|uniref:monovalent cation/H+ antiporter complex subunit F n=1 Tax=Brachybacterium sp. YJGR34 TaxID=2059911 RepID=UPI0013003181|nr:monovalent cation/H+ antiporter complex subunit F [Brachybacterium sp. YJGR34]
MSAFELVLLIYGGVLALAAVAVVYRMIVGPTILDRALSSDALVTLVVMGMALYSAHAGAAWAGPAMLGLTGLAFIGTVTFARFVGREDPRRGIGAPHPREPQTDTGPHEAIHAGPATAPVVRRSEEPADAEPRGGDEAAEPANRVADVTGAPPVDGTGAWPDEDTAWPDQGAAWPDADAEEAPEDPRPGPGREEQR